MVKRILVPLDGSELAEWALPIAERLARATGATLHLVRVADPVFEASTAAVSEDMYDEFLAAQMRKASAYLERVRGRLAAAGLTVRTRRVSGSIAGALLDYERAEGSTSWSCAATAGRA